MKWPLLTLLLAFSAALFGQHAAHQGARSVQPIVDGSTNPELISDRLAINLFILAVTEPPDATPERLARLKGKIRRMNLDEQDTAAFIAGITAAHNQLTAIQQSKHQGADIENQNMITYSSILAALSPEGAEKLREHVEYVKTKIKIIPQP